MSIPQPGSPDWNTWAKNECISECGDMILPTKNFGRTFQRCVSKCLYDNNCGGNDYPEGFLVWLGAGTEVSERLEGMSMQDVNEIFAPLVNAIDKFTNDSEQKDVFMITRDLVTNLLNLYMTTINTTDKDHESESDQFKEIMGAYAACMKVFYKSDMPTDYRSTYPLVAIFDIISSLPGASKASCSV